MSQLPVTVPVESLPGLLARTSQALAAATSAAEVLVAANAGDFAYGTAKAVGRFAEKKGAHDEVVAAAHKAQADALEIVTQAQVRLAKEWNEAQQRGEVGQEGRPKAVTVGNGFAPATVADLVH